MNYLATGPKVEKESRKTQFKCCEWCHPVVKVNWWYKSVLFFFGLRPVVLSQCYFTVRITKLLRASQPWCWCLSKDLVSRSNPAGVTGCNAPPRAGVFGSNLLPLRRFERPFLNPVLNLCLDLWILTSLLFLQKWDAWLSHVLIWDWNNIVGEASWGIVHSLLLLLLEVRKEKKILSDELIMTSCSPVTSPPVSPLTLNHWLCMFDPAFSSCTCPVFHPQIYKEQLNTRVVLVAVETWTEKDHIDITTNPVQMLHEFSKYRQRIKQHADAVHLISYVPVVFGFTLLFIPLLYQLSYMSTYRFWTGVMLIPLCDIRSMEVGCLVLGGWSLQSLDISSENLLPSDLPSTRSTWDSGWLLVLQPSLQEAGMAVLEDGKRAFLPAELAPESLHTSVSPRSHLLNLTHVATLSCKRG